MSKTEFLQILRDELEGRVPYSVIQENLSYYDTYISQESAKGKPEEQVIQELGGPRIIARTIVDAALDTEDRPDGYQAFGMGEEEYSQAESSQKQYQDPYQNPEDLFRGRRSVHYIDFSKWYIRLIAGLIVFAVIFLVLTILFGILGFAGWVLSYLWPVLLVLLVISFMKGPRD